MADGWKKPHPQSLPPQLVQGAAQRPAGGAGGVFLPGDPFALVEGGARGPRSRDSRGYRSGSFTHGPPVASGFSCALRRRAGASAPLARRTAGGPAVAGLVAGGAPAPGGYSRATSVSDF